MSSMTSKNMMTAIPKNKPNPPPTLEYKSEACKQMYQSVSYRIQK